MTNSQYFFNRYFDYLFYFFTLFVVYSLSGCGVAQRDGFSATGGPGPLVKEQLSTSSRDNFLSSKLNQIAILPLERGITTDISTYLLEQYSAQLVSVLELRTSLDLLNLSDDKGYQKALSSVVQTQALKTKAIELGRSLGVQGVMYGVLSEYKDPIDTKDNRVIPAVAFRLWLLDIASEEVVWQATYENRQKALSENLFALRRALKDGIRFRSASDLLKTGFSEAAERLEQWHKDSAAGS